MCLLRRGRVWKRNLRWPSWQPSYPPARPASVLFHPRLSGPVPALPPHQRPLLSCPRCLRGPGCAEPDSETPFQRRPLRLSCCRGERTREDVWEGRCQPRAKRCACLTLAYIAPLCPATALRRQRGPWRSLCLAPRVSRRVWRVRRASPETTVGHQSCYMSSNSYWRLDCLRLFSPLWWLSLSSRKLFL